MNYAMKQTAMKRLASRNLHIFCRHANRTKIMVRSMCSEVHEVAQTGFTKETSLYEKTRPTYPQQALDHIIKAAKLHADNEGTVYEFLDVAAGTGKFSRVLLTQPQLRVTALEPVEAMRKQFIKVVPPYVPIIEGLSTDIPFANSTFHALSCAQAFHWFANKESVLEFRRVLKKDGALILIWNLEDASVPWISDIRNAYEKYDIDVPQYRKEEWKHVFQQNKDLPFSPISSTFFKQTMLVSKIEVWQRILSKSYIASLSPEEQAKLKLEVDKILETHNDAFNIKRPDGPLCANQSLVTEVAMAFAK